MRKQLFGFCGAVSVAALLCVAFPTACRNDSSGNHQSHEDAGDGDAAHDAGDGADSALDASDAGPDTSDDGASDAADGATEDAADAGDAADDGDAASSFSVVSSVPANGDKNVGRDASVVVTFSADVKPSTITPASFNLYLGPAEDTPVQTVYAVSGRTATLTPARVLYPGAGYHAVIRSSVTSAAGSALAQDYSLSFGTLAHVSLMNDPPLGTVTQVGIVRESGGTLECGIYYRDCEGDYPYDSTLTLTAVPAQGFLFDGWGGDDCRDFGMANPIHLVMHGAPTCAANFAVPFGLTFTMTVTYGPWVARIIDQAERPWGSPPKIDCGQEPQTGERCSGSFTADIGVNFVAYPTALAPAGNFRWRCTNNNPFESSEAYYTGTSAFIRFLTNTSCYVEWIPNPP